MGAAASSRPQSAGKLQRARKIKQNDTKGGLAASLLSFLGLFAKLHWAKSNFWDRLGAGFLGTSCGKDEGQAGCHRSQHGRVSVPPGIVGEEQSGAVPHLSVLAAPEKAHSQPWGCRGCAGEGRGQPQLLG